MSAPFEGDPLKKHEGDVDLSWTSLHHTLGAGPTQAAAGKHKHKAEDITDLAGEIPPPVDESKFVKIAGDTMTGDLNIAPVTGKALMKASSSNSYSTVEVNGSDTQSQMFQFSKNSSQRWKFIQSGSAAADLQLNRYDDSGSYLSPAPIAFNRSTGVTSIPRLTYQSTANVSYSSGWTTSEATLVTLYADMVTVELYCLRSSNLTIASGTAYPIFTVPVGYRPVKNNVYSGYGMIGGVRQACLFVQSPADGVVNFRFIGTGGTFVASSDYVAGVLTYRQGN